MKHKSTSLEMLKGLPTPNTLSEAIEQALTIGPLNEVPERTYHIIRDFMAQKFNVAYLEADQDEKTLKILENLFKSLTRVSK